MAAWKAYRERGIGLPSRGAGVTLPLLWLVMVGGSSPHPAVVWGVLGRVVALRLTSVGRRALRAWFFFRHGRSDSEARRDNQPTTARCEVTHRLNFRLWSLTPSKHNACRRCS